MNDKYVKKTAHTPLGVFSGGEKVFLFYHLTRDEGSFFRIESSPDGVNFSLFHPICQITDEDGQRVNSGKISDFHLAKTHSGYVLTYKYRGADKNLFIAKSENLAMFENIASVAGTGERGTIVPDYQHLGQNVMYYGENSIQIAYSYDFLKWQVRKEPVILPKNDFFGTSELLISNSYLIDEGILVFYYDYKKAHGGTHYFLHAAIFDKNDPTKLIKIFEDPIWSPNRSWHDMNLKPVGVVLLKGVLLSYWQGKKGVLTLIHPFALDRALEKESLPHLVLKKLKHNPLIRPIIDNFWESKATFNPAAIYDDGRVHLVYRAIGDEDISVLGYATSLDGIHIDFRQSEPIYQPTKPFEGKGIRSRVPSLNNFSPYQSGGGGNGGIEDPRLTKIDGRIYMTYVAYDGASPPRVALTSISEGDFRSQDWNWEEPVLITKPGEVNKNACILPDKIGGKYVIFHRVFPNILIDFVDDLNFDGTRFLDGHYKISPKEGSWDSRKIGIGATPIETPDGWLVIYQAVGDNDSGKYKVGAMVLAKNDPTKVLFRSKSPIIEPVEHYENEGHKSGVVYPCGAVKLNNELIVYYGGADTVVCAAHENFDFFMKKLKEDKEEDIRAGFLIN